MTESRHTLPPVLDHAVLARLRCQVDAGIFRGFIADYVRLLPGRLARLNLALMTMDHDAAMDAVLSLKTSSLMVGAALLGTLAGDLESRLKATAVPGTGTGALPSASVFQAHLVSIQDCVAATTAPLSAQAAAAR